MADIVLAECNGNFWLVKGDQHVDALMLNTLDPALVIAFEPCSGGAEAFAMWETRTSGDFELQVPWLINPKVAQRILGTLGQGAILFTPWSAMLDPQAQAVIAATVEWLRANFPARIVLRQFTPADPPPGLDDLQRLRAQLVAGAMARAGADPAALEHETAPSTTPGDHDRVEVLNRI